MPGMADREGRNIVWKVTGNLLEDRNISIPADYQDVR